MILHFTTDLRIKQERLAEVFYTFRILSEILSPFALCLWLFAENGGIILHVNGKIVESRAYPYKKAIRRFLCVRLPLKHKKRAFPSRSEKRSKKPKSPYLLIRTRYPVFSPCEDGEKEKPSEKRFCEKINRFYAESAERFASDVPPKDRKKAILLAEKSQKPCSFVWHTEVPFNGKELLSVFTDISGFDGENTVKRRFCARGRSQERLAAHAEKRLFHRCKAAKKCSKNALRYCRKQRTARNFYIL